MQKKNKEEIFHVVLTKIAGCNGLHMTYGMILFDLFRAFGLLVIAVFSRIFLEGFGNAKSSGARLAHQPTTNLQAPRKDERLLCHNISLTKQIVDV